MCAARSSVMLWCSKQFQFYSFCPSCSKVCVSEGLKSMQTVFFLLSKLFRSVSNWFKMAMNYLFLTLLFSHPSPGSPKRQPWFYLNLLFDLARGDKERTADSHVKWLKRLKSHVEMSSKWVLLSCFGTVSCHRFALSVFCFRNSILCDSIHLVCIISFFKLIF